MAERDPGPEALAHAYRVLNVPWDASPRAIKASYYKLVQRWHPDHHSTGTEGHADYTLMTKLLNEAYALIKAAPLQSAEKEADPSSSSRTEYIPRDPVRNVADYYRILENARAAGARDDATRPFDWLGFAVRFVVGALFGALLSFRVIIYLPQEKSRFIALGIVGTILFCAFASGFGGDAFWRAIRPYGVWWWNRWD
ncbi:MAG: J domain-containing protein [Candidatus Acidiferrales bacterium]